MDGCCDDSVDLARILVRVPEDGGDVDGVQAFEVGEEKKCRVSSDQ